MKELYKSDIGPARLVSCVENLDFDTKKKKEKKKKQIWDEPSSRLVYLSRIGSSKSVLPY